MDKFVVGEKTPQWFDFQVSLGRAKVNYEGKNLVNIIIYTPTGTSVAYPGDVIIKTESGMIAVPEDKAVKFRIKNNNQKRRRY